MKHLMTLERFGPRISYKLGDYVLVSSIYWGLNHEPMIIDKVDEDVFTCSFVHGYPQSVGFNKRIGSGAEFDRNEIIRKMEPHEISAIKYNL